jgi:superfamily II DNA or RNA helicase
MIANIRAGGVGISLQDKNGTYGRVSLISPTWSSIELKQALGRIHRAGGLTPCIQRIVYCKGRVSAVGPKVPDNAIVVGRDDGGLVIQGRAADHPELKKKIEDNLGNDTTFVSHEGKGRIGVEELMAENVNVKLRTIEWFNNGDDKDLHQF